MKDWNAPGIAVGIVVKDKLVFAKGYGYRDLENKLPLTPQTRQPQYELIPYKPRTFKMKQFSDTIIQFIAEDNRITGYKNIDPAGELFVRRK